MDDLSQYTATPEFRMVSTRRRATFVTRFKSNELNYATRWILYNGDQKVGAFVLSLRRPEGFLAAKITKHCLVRGRGKLIEDCCLLVLKSSFYFKKAAHCCLLLIC